MGIGGHAKELYDKEDQITYLDNLRERKKLAWGNHTMEDLEKEKKAEVMRVSPITMEES